jgi:hypothetical protein
MSDYDMSIHSSTDAREWTDFFFETHPNCNVDREAMFGWFANAMMAMYDNKQEVQEPVAWIYSGAEYTNPHKHNNGLFQNVELKETK